MQPIVTMEDLFSSTSTLLVVGQFGLMLLLGCVMFALYARRAARRKAVLVQRLKSMSQLYHSTFILLTRTLANGSNEKRPEEPEQDSFLQDKLTKTLAHLKTLGTEETMPKADTDPDIQSAQVRYQMLLAEQELTRNNPAPNIFWINYTGRMQKLIKALIPDQTTAVVTEAIGSSGTKNVTSTRSPDESLAEIESLKRTIENLKAKLKQKEVYRDQVLDEWEGKKNQITQHYDRLLKATRRADNRNELTNILTGLFNDCADLGERISGERIKHKGVDALDYDEAAALDVGTVHQIDNSAEGGMGKVIVAKTAAGRKREALKAKSPMANVKRAMNKDVIELKSVVQKQRLLIVKLRDRVKDLETKSDPNLLREYEQQVMQLEQLLNENDTNIANLEGELSEAGGKIDHLEDELFIALDALAHYQAGDVDAIRQLTEEQLQSLEKERERLAAKKAAKK